MKKHFKTICLIFSIVFCGFIIGSTESVFAKDCDAQVCGKRNLISGVFDRTFGGMWQS